MGDRGNIAIVVDGNKPITEGGAVWLYGHWSGSRLPSIVQEALTKGAGRINDPTYFARITLNVMQGDDRGECGYGLHTRPSDNEWNYLLVNGEAGKVQVLAWDRETHDPKDVLAEWTIDQFKALKLDEVSPNELVKLSPAIEPVSPELAKLAPELLAACELALTRKDWPVGAMKIKAALASAVAKAKNATTT